MNSYVYISCLKEERNLPQVIKLCQWLMSNHLIYIFGNGCCHISGETSGFAMKRCAAFVAVAGDGYNQASWLNGEFHEAWGRSLSNPDHRPFLFGLGVDEDELPRCSQDIPIHWLDLEQSYLNAEQGFTELLSGSEGEQAAT